MIRRSLLILVAFCFSTTAFAQGAPKAGNKPPSVGQSRKRRLPANSLERSEARSYGPVTAWDVERLKGPTETPEQKQV